MIYEFSHFLQNRLPFLWDFIEWGNSILFRLRCGRRLQAVDKVLKSYPSFYEVSEEHIPALVSFFASQPEDAFKHFRPHDFDEKTLRKLQKRKSFLMFCAGGAEGEITGYFFLRCFFIGKAFLGKMVEWNSRGKGIGTEMCKCAMDIAKSLGLRMFESISKENEASLRSTAKVLDMKVIKELDNNYLLIEDLKRK